MSAEQSTQTTEATEATVETHEGETATETSYLDGKYTSVSALEDGYRNLQTSYSKKLGAFQGAPEDGYALEEGAEGNAVLEAWGKDNNLSQDGYAALVEQMSTAQNEANEAFKTEQLQALGENADYRLKNIVDYAKATFGEDSLGTFDAMIQDAKGVEIIEALIKGSKSEAPAEVKATPIDADKVKAMRFEVDANSGQRRMSVDPTFRAKVEAAEAQLYAK